MVVLVTGGAGFIGSHLVDALVRRGDEVVVVDEFSAGFRENLQDGLDRGARLVEADVRDAGAMSELLERVEPEIVFHLAAQMDVRRSARDPVFDAGVNVLGTIALLEAARAARVRRFVNASTGGVIYRQDQPLPAAEDHPIAPIAPYAVSKLAGEAYCDVYRRLHGLSTISLRLGNVYGPRQNPHSEAGVIAIFCGCLVRGERPTVFGDGRQTRDFLHVDDAVAAMLAAAGSEATGVLNVGTGTETSVLQLIEALSRHADGEFEPSHAAKRPEEMERVALDSSRAREELRWTPRVGLREGLEGTIRWLRQHPERA